jgi:hypothetical protein
MHAQTCAHALQTCVIHAYGHLRMDLMVCGVGTVAPTQLHFAGSCRGAAYGAQDWCGSNLACSSMAVRLLRRIHNAGVPTHPLNPGVQPAARLRTCFKWRRFNHTVAELKGPAAGGSSAKAAAAAA